MSDTSINSIADLQKDLLPQNYGTQAKLLKYGSITAIVIGILAVVALGGIGIASLVQAHGIHMPQCFEWLTPISQTHNAWGAWTMAVCGTVLGTLSIAVGARKYQVFKNALEDDLNKIAWQNLYNLITVTSADEMNYEYDDEMDEFSKNTYQNHTVYRIEFQDQANTYHDYAYMIKTPEGIVIPTPLIPVNETEKHNTLSTLLGQLGYTLDFEQQNAQEIPEDPMDN